MYILIYIIQIDVLTLSSHSNLSDVEILLPKRVRSAIFLPFPNHVSNKYHFFFWVWTQRNRATDGSVSVVRLEREMASLGPLAGEY